MLLWLCVFFVSECALRVSSNSSLFVEWEGDNRDVHREDRRQRQRCRRDRRRNTFPVCLPEPARVPDVHNGLTKRAIKEKKKSLTITHLQILRTRSYSPIREVYRSRRFWVKKNIYITMGEVGKNKQLCLRCDCGSPMVIPPLRFCLLVGRWCWHDPCP